jgi:hypothetical protein
MTQSTHDSPDTVYFLRTVLVYKFIALYPMFFKQALLLQKHLIDALRPVKGCRLIRSFQTVGLRIFTSPNFSVFILKRGINAHKDNSEILVKLCITCFGNLVKVSPPLQKKSEVIPVTGRGGL